MTMGAKLADSPHQRIQPRKGAKRARGVVIDRFTGLYNYFRDYDPAIGRYVESDPAGFWDGPNTYAYVGSNPLAWQDDFGLGKVGAAVKAIKWGKSAWNHVINGHIGKKKLLDKTKFCKPCQIKKNADKTVKNPDNVIKQWNGNTRYERMFEKPVGTQGERGQAVVVNKHGEGVTTFPIGNITVPGANLGVAILGDNFFGQACDFFNPLSDLQDVINLVTGASDEDDD